MYDFTSPVSKLMTCCSTVFMPYKLLWVIRIVRHCCKYCCYDTASFLWASFNLSLLSFTTGFGFVVYISDIF